MLLLRSDNRTKEYLPPPACEEPKDNKKRFIKKHTVKKQTYKYTIFKGSQIFIVKNKLK